MESARLVSALSVGITGRLAWSARLGSSGWMKPSGSPGPTTHWIIARMRGKAQWLPIVCMIAKMNG